MYNIEDEKLISLILVLNKNSCKSSGIIPIDMSCEIVSAIHPLDFVTLSDKQGTY